ncbi:MAG: hypothetical protein DSY85_15380 [Marinomonas sp.]|nr:MAG: hypothetical protein DSY85_15380 [Marinomonas sp.]
MDDLDFKNKVGLVSSSLELAMKNEDIEAIEKIDLVIKKMIDDGFFSTKNVQDHESLVANLYNLIRSSESLIKNSQRKLSEEKKTSKKKVKGVKGYLKVRGLK